MKAWYDPIIANSTNNKTRRGFRGRGGLFFHAFCEVVALREFVIWARPAGKHLQIGKHRADSSPIPFGAEIVTRVIEPDLDMMLKWAEKRAKRGWSVSKLRAACE